jgi:hypothetical protein
VKKRIEENYVAIVGSAFVAALILVSVALWLLKKPEQQAANNNAAPSPETNSDKKDKGAKKEKKNAPTAATRWTSDNTYESSGAVWIPGTNQVLFVDDKASRNIDCVTLDQDGNQSGDIIPVPLGVEVDDAEDLTFDGTYVYVIGSQFRKKTDKGDGIVRFKYDPQSHAVSELQGIEDLKGLLEKNVTELATSQGQVRTEDAINIEGLGWDPNGKRLMLGFRDPLVNGVAMVVPVSLKDANAGFTADNLSFAPAIKLDLEGLAIRAIEWDAAKSKFVIVAGATEGEKKSDFYLWSWDGSGTPTRVVELDKKMKPEGITSVDLNGDHFLYVVGDAGYYLRLDDPIQ